MIYHLTNSNPSIVSFSLGAKCNRRVLLQFFKPQSDSHDSGNQTWSPALIIVSFLTYWATELTSKLSQLRLVIYLEKALKADKTDQKKWRQEKIILGLAENCFKLDLFSHFQYSVGYNDNKCWCTIFKWNTKRKELLSET